MSVVPMQKVRLLIHASDVDAALAIVQKAGALEFRPSTLDGAETTKITVPNAQLLPRVQHAVRFLEVYRAEVGLWQTLREGTRTELTEAEAEKRLQDMDTVTSVVNDLEDLQVEFADANEKVRSLEEQKDLLTKWQELTIRLRDLSTHKTTTLLLETHVLPGGNPLGQFVFDTLTEQQVPHLITKVNDNQIALTISNEGPVVSATKRLLEEQGIEVVNPPMGTETPAIELTRITADLLKAKNDLALLHDQAEHFAITHLRRLELASEILLWQHDRFAVLETAGTTKYLLAFDGWLNEQKRAGIELAFTQKGLAAAFTELEIEEGEQPPVEIENSPLIAPFEAVTRLYGMPGYKDLDPTLFLAGFFFLFFGLSLTDVGYGLALVLVSGFLLLFCKITKATRLFAKLLLFIGFATVVVGALFGGYLGVDPAVLPEFLQKIQLFDPIKNPLPVFYLALGLGVFQVMVGMILKIYSDARNGQLLSGILDQGPWLLMFLIGILYIATTTGYTSLLPTETIGNLAWVAAALIVLASGRNGEGIVGKIISAAAGLYAGVGHFSDILSYSRLLALGLATSALAFAVNLIAGMVIDVPIVGFILAGAIFLIGHLFTLAINTLGAFVHSARLQFVEFFGKFITGTGKEFSPLSRTETYITIRDD